MAKQKTLGEVDAEMRREALRVERAQKRSPKPDVDLDSFTIEVHRWDGAWSASLEGPGFGPESFDTVEDLGEAVKAEVKYALEEWAKSVGERTPRL